MRRRLAALRELADARELTGGDSRFGRRSVWASQHVRGALQAIESS